MSLPRLAKLDFADHGVGHIVFSRDLPLRHISSAQVLLDERAPSSPFWRPIRAFVASRREFGVQPKRMLVAFIGAPMADFILGVFSGGRPTQISGAIIASVAIPMRSMVRCAWLAPVKSFANELVYSFFPDVERDDKIAILVRGGGHDPASGPGALSNETLNAPKVGNCIIWRLLNSAPLFYGVVSHGRGSFASWSGSERRFNALRPVQSLA
jgi:hypothetical protein